MVGSGIAQSEFHGDKPMALKHRKWLQEMAPASASCWFPRSSAPNTSGHFIWWSWVLSCLVQEVSWSSSPIAVRTACRRYGHEDRLFRAETTDLCAVPRIYYRILLYLVFWNSSQLGLLKNGSSNPSPGQDLLSGGVAETLPRTGGWGLQIEQGDQWHPAGLPLEL